MPKNGRKRTRTTTPVRDLRFLHTEGRWSRVEVLRLSALRRRELDSALLGTLTRPDFHAVFLFTAGEGAHIVDFEPLPVRAGDVVHVRPHQIHHFGFEDDTEAFVLVFRPDILPPGEGVAAIDRLRPRVLAPTPADFERLTSLCALVERLGRGPSELDLLPVLDGVVLALWAALRQLWAASEGQGTDARSAEQERVRAFEGLAEAHLAQRRAVTWYAARIGVSPRSLMRDCHRVLGLSPKRYLDALLALEARRRLAASLDSIEQISEALGFSEPTNFTKFFVRTTGRTPRDFRSRARGP